MIVESLRPKPSSDTACQCVDIANVEVINSRFSSSVNFLKSEFILPRGLAQAERFGIQRRPQIEVEGEHHRIAACARLQILQTSLAGNLESKIHKQVWHDA
jgi:hypothetical protein